MISLVVLSNATEAVVTQFPRFGNERHGAAQYAKNIDSCIVLPVQYLLSTDNIVRQLQLTVAHSVSS